MKLSHCFPHNSQPFLSLSTLNTKDALLIIQKFASNSELVYRRFKNPKQYLIDRQATESWLLEEFTKKGGLPKDLYPTYFVLGDSPYVYEGYDKNCQEISFDINDFPDDQVSFTFPDSMVSRYLLDRQDEIYFQKEYHGIVFTKEEIIRLVRSTGLPQNEWKTDSTRKYDFFVEAQVWDKSLLKLSE